MSSLEEAWACRGPARGEGWTLSAPSISSYMSKSARAVRSAGVPFALPLSVRPVCLSVESPTAPFAYEVDRLASLPEALVAELLTAGVETLRFGVSSLLRFGERGESSMVAFGTFELTAGVIGASASLRRRHTSSHISKENAWLKAEAKSESWLSGRVRLQVARRALTTKHNLGSFRCRVHPCLPST